jgi:DNA-binding transcriptional MerR regulator
MSQKILIFAVAKKNTNVMALNTEKNLKLYYSIKEVSEMVGVSESNLRFWEKEIPLIKPKTTGNNVRQYTEKDIENIRAVYNLVKVRGFKLAAAKKMLRENKEGVDKNARVMEGLIKVRDELKELKKQLDYLT